MGVCDSSSLHFRKIPSNKEKKILPTYNLMNSIQSKNGSFKNNIGSNYTFEKNQILPKTIKSRNISYLKEDIHSRKKLKKNTNIF